MNLTTLTTINPAIIVGAVALILLWWSVRSMRKNNVMATLPTKFDAFFRSQAVTVITLGLIANTLLAQLYIRSDGTIIPPGDWKQVYVIASAIAATLAFSLFEIVQVRMLNELFNDGMQHGFVEWFKNILATVFASAYNCYAIANLDYGLAHPGTGLPDMSKFGSIWLTAFGFTALLFFVSLVGERKKSTEQEVNDSQRDITRVLLARANGEANDVINTNGHQQPGKAVTAMIVLGTPKARAFFGNIVNIYRDRVTLEDVLADTPGVIQPGRATGGNSTATDEEDGNTGTAASGHYSNVIALLADHPDLANFKLPGDLTLLTIMSISEMAHALKIRKEDLLTAWRQGGMTPARAPQPGEPHNVITIAVWQVLQLWLDKQLATLPPDVILIAQSVENV